MWASLKRQMKTQRLDFHRSKISYQDTKKAWAGITTGRGFLRSLVSDSVELTNQVLRFLNPGRKILMHHGVGSVKFPSLRTDPS